VVGIRRHGKDLMFFLYYLEGRMIPHEGDEKDIAITLETVFTFATGADHEPPLGFENQPDIKFDMRKERFLPYASTCGPTLYLPIVLTDPDLFKEKMDYAITGAHGFGNP
jgi:hypothetical protein